MKDASQASIGSVGYSLVRAFRTKTLELIFAPLTALLEQNKLSGRDLKFSLETAGWEMIQQQRTDTLPADFSSWRSLVATGCAAKQTKVRNRLWQFSQRQLGQLSIRVP